MQFLLTQEEMDKLKGAVEGKEPEHTTVFAADFVDMMKLSHVEVVAHPDMMGKEVFTLRVEVKKIPLGIKHLLEAQLGKKL